jgi:membrane-bound lytic murein transglycosylase D
MGGDLFRRKTIILLLFLSILFAVSPPCPGESSEYRLQHWTPKPDQTRREDGFLRAGEALTVLHDRSAEALLELGVPEDPAVGLWRQRILAAGSAAVEQALARGRIFRRFISDRLTHRGLPQELIYLPVLESHYRVRAVSRSGATGLWQIMANTAAPLGLVTDRWIDERRDFWKSTEGALKKLEENYGIFGNWDLALAAYNCGVGKLSRTIRSSGIRDFWQLREQGHLPPETAAYVPKFYALVSICSDPTAYGLDIDWQESPSFQEILLERSLELALLAEEAGLSLSLMEEAHGELQTPITPPAVNTGYRLKVPYESVERVREVLADPQKDLLRFTFHRIRSGDTFYGLAEYYDLNVGLLMEANAGENSRPNQSRASPTRILLPPPTPLQLETLSGASPDGSVQPRRCWPG